MYRSKNFLIFMLLLLVAVVIHLVFESGVGIIPVAAMALVPFTDLSKDADTCNMAGIATIVYVIPHDDISVWPVLPTNKSLPEHTVDLVGNFTLNPGKYWRTFYSTQEMGELLSEVDGPRDGKFFKNTGSFFFPQTTSRALGIANLFKNRDVVILLKEFNGTGNGLVRVVGTSLLPAMVNPKVTSGKSFTDQKGITFEFDASSCSVAYVYTGTIVTEAAEIQTPTQLSLNATNIDGSLGGRFIPNASQALALAITTFTNCLAGNTIRIENNKNLNVVITLSFGGEITLAENEYADILFVEDNLPVVTNSNISYFS